MNRFLYIQVNALDFIISIKKVNHKKPHISPWQVSYGMCTVSGLEKTLESYNLIAL